MEIEVLPTNKKFVKRCLIKSILLLMTQLVIWMEFKTSSDPFHVLQISYGELWQNFQTKISTNFMKLQFHEFFFVKIFIFLKITSFFYHFFRVLWASTNEEIVETTTTKIPWTIRKIWIRKMFIWVSDQRQMPFKITVLRPKRPRLLQLQLTLWLRIVLI